MVARRDFLSKEAALVRPYTVTRHETSVPGSFGGRRPRSNRAAYRSVRAARRAAADAGRDPAARAQIRRELSESILDRYDALNEAGILSRLRAIASSVVRPRPKPPAPPVKTQADYARERRLKALQRAARQGMVSIARETLVNRFSSLNESGVLRVVRARLAADREALRAGDKSAVYRIKGRQLELAKLRKELQADKARANQVKSWKFI